MLYALEAFSRFSRQLRPKSCGMLVGTLFKLCQFVSKKDAHHYMMWNFESGQLDKIRRKTSEQWPPNSGRTPMQFNKVCISIQTDDLLT